MKEFKQDSSKALSMFAKDARLRAKKSEDNDKKENAKKRTSFNPNFSSDNRPLFKTEKPVRREKDNVSEGKSERPRGKRNESKFSSSRHNQTESKTNGQKGGTSHKPFDRNATHRAQKEQTRNTYPKYARTKAPDEIRLNRFIAQSGICSRREADSYIEAGLVTVNGQIVTELGVKVHKSDDVRFNGERMQGEKNVYLLLNKPKGYVTTTQDDHAAKTVMELVHDACKERIYPVGRLDKNSLGLLLFTNDGDLTKILTHPSYQKKKIYEVTLNKALTKADFDKLSEGIMLEDGEAFFDEIQYVSEDKKSIGCEIHSGRNRIVRRMFEHLGYAVEKLDRVYYAGLTKKDLKRGAWRFLSKEEVARLKSGRYE
ncbi:MAG: rRNA pseudouridine synthase [Alistipes sp.]|nr:rRNA pseudouridine synthase [Candidatus Alistipes equi]